MGKFDKTGKKVNKEDRMMHKYYQIDKDGQASEGDDKSSASADAPADRIANRFYDDEGNF